MKGADLCSFRRAVQNSNFEKVLLTNFIITNSKLLKHFTFAHLLLMKSYRKRALQKEPVIAPFVDSFEAPTLRKPY